VALAATETVSYGVLSYAFAVFLPVMRTDLGWSSTAISGAYTLALLVSAAAAVPVGRWLDRHGPRWLMTVGSLAASLLVFAWAATQTLWGFYLAWAGIGLTMAAVLYEPAFATITRQFPDPRERDRALVLLTVVAGFASTIFVPLSQWLVDTRGWRTALTVLAVLLAACTVPPHALLLPGQQQAPPLTIRPADSKPDAPGIAARTAIRLAGFWWLAASITLATVGNSAITVHLVAALQERHYSSQVAATVTGLLGATAVLGRLLLIPAGRRRPRTQFTAYVFAGQAVGLAILLTWPHPPGLAMFVLLFGVGRGIVSLARASLVAEFYGRGQYATINGTIALLVTLANALAPLAVGALRTALGSYTPILWVLAATAMLACAAMLQAAHHQPAQPREP
jgi:MFS family permease